LATYDAWRTTGAGEPLRVLVDGTAQAVAADGSFDAGADARTVLVCQGALCTRVRPAAQLPFADARLATP
jgi:hypothetical protein